MKVSTVLSFVTLVLASFVCAPAKADTLCGPSSAGPLIRRCTSQVDARKFSQSYSTQKMSQWCWAAAVSMVFDYYGHPVAQEKIVQATFGSVKNLPAGNGWTLASQLNRDWTDERGVPFRARLTAAYDPAAGVNAMNNLWIINELDHERPLIVGTQGHAIVVTSIMYDQTPQGPVVLSVGAFDPWPGRGARYLTPNEMFPSPNGLSFAASVAVSALQ